ncbi:MAG: GyrI-like domain-containing protein [Chloroflexi bacterium]|nr:GyrI-like domain-containing protein [Chloroflexota bacterium]MCL5274875.1 GyrI-like domain-containing protein [Chloroflexota bacterium]
MLKLDLKRKFRHLYNPTPRHVTVVDVPDWNYLMIDGAGDPNTAVEYQDAVNALYSVAYTLKFMIRKGDSPVDYPVMPLEGLWWCDDTAEFSALRKDNWQWTMMIMQPEFVTLQLVTQALALSKEKKPLPTLAQVRFEPYVEGLSAQIMHLGPYAYEAPTIGKLHAYIAEQGYRRRGKHHEIYLSDPRRTAPSRLKTILRQPIA